jgi:hypothetical protein
VLPNLPETGEALNMLAMKSSRRLVMAAQLAVIAVAWVAMASKADVVTDSNAATAEIAGASGLSTPAVNRVMALVQTAVYAAANSVTRRYPDDELGLGAARDASIDAAIAAAQRTTLSRLLPSPRRRTAIARTRAPASTSRRACPWRRSGPRASRGS